MYSMDHLYVIDQFVICKIKIIIYRESKDTVSLNSQRFTVNLIQKVH
jgi:hypothetical protein